VERDEERDWVRRASTGDRDAFAALVDRYWGAIRAWLTGLTGHIHLAEDLTQEAFLKAWVALPGLAAAEVFRVWLYRIARNEYLAALRRPQTASTDGLSDDHSDHPDPPDPAPDPAAAAIEHEEEAALRIAIGKLPVMYREAYLLWTHESLAYPEIARVLDVTEETARWRVCEARRRLTRILEKFLTP
jgi:RNA polymerase sigma-70 factor (ECF subfamily)